MGAAPSNPHNLYVTGRRVALRPLEPSEAPVLAAWLNDARVRLNVAQYRPLDVATETAFLQAANASKDTFVLGITVPGEKDGTRRLVGVCGLHDLHPRDHRAVFGIFLGDPADWGQGFGTEATDLLLKVAFDWLNLHRVDLTVHADNPRGIRAYEKVGFVREGRLREYQWKDGAWVDAIVMGCLAAKWRKLHAGAGDATPPKKRRTAG